MQLIRYKLYQSGSVSRLNLNIQSKREQQLRKMIESMLNQTPMTENDMTHSIQSNGNNLTNSESDYFRQKIRDMVDDQSLTDKEKKNLQKLAQLMN